MKKKIKIPFILVVLLSLIFVLVVGSYALWFNYSLRLDNKIVLEYRLYSFGTYEYYGLLISGTGQIYYYYFENALELNFGELGLEERTKVLKDNSKYLGKMESGDVLEMRRLISNIKQKENVPAQDMIREYKILILYDYDNNLEKVIYSPQEYTNTKDLTKLLEILYNKYKINELI